jgi:general secretion pathway protein G
MKTQSKPDPKKGVNHLRRRAFTLVELLLVLAILALLAGLVLPKLAGTGERAKVKAAVAQLDAFKTALNLFEVENGHYPKGKNGLMDLMVKPRDATTDWHKYLDTDKLPLDPWQHEYVYVFPGRHNPDSYDLSSAGPDGQLGNEDDINNWTTK